MSGPWERYQQAAPAAAPAPAGGPWTRYQQAAPTGPKQNPDGTYGSPPPEMVFDPKTGGYRDLALNPTISGEDPTRTTTFGTGVGRGVSANFMDEVQGQLAAWDGSRGGTPDQRREYATRLMRSDADAKREAYPNTMLAGEITGAVAGSAGLPGTSAATVAGTVARGTAAGAGFGALYAAGDAEGGAVDRLPDVASGAVLGGLFGGGTAATLAVGTRAFQRLYNGALKRPTTETLRAAKNAAYKAVDDSGEVFTSQELAAVAQKARAEIEGNLNYVPEVDQGTTAALSILDRVAGRDLTIGQLDKVRQGLWDRVNRTGEHGIYDAIDAIDDAIQSRAGTSELMSAARAANAQFKKTEMLEMAFKKAEDQTASTGSGGNILNKYRQAVTQIINNPKRAKWFNEEELATMQKVIDGGFGEDALRRVGKMSPSGNGLMMFLNLMGGATVGPEFLAVTATGAGAKALADRSGSQNVNALLGQVSGATSRPPIPYDMGINALAGQQGAR